MKVVFFALALAGITGEQRIIAPAQIRPQTADPKKRIRDVRKKIEQRNHHLQHTRQLKAEQ